MQQKNNMGIDHNNRASRLLRHYDANCTHGSIQPCDYTSISERVSQAKDAAREALYTREKIIEEKVNKRLHVLRQNHLKKEALRIERKLKTSQQKVETALQKVEEALQEAQKYMHAKISSLEKRSTPNSVARKLQCYEHIISKLQSKTHSDQATILALQKQLYDNRRLLAQLEQLKSENQKLCESKEEKNFLIDLLYEEIEFLKRKNLQTHVAENSIRTEEGELSGSWNPKFYYITSKETEELNIKQENLQQSDPWATRITDTKDTNHRNMVIQKY